MVCINIQTVVMHFQKNVYEKNIIEEINNFM